MTDNEVNKIIAEFMGLDYIDFDKDPDFIYRELLKGACILDKERQEVIPYDTYTKSLDSLVSAWEKMENYGYQVNLYTDKKECDLGTYHDFLTEGMGSIQQAAAHATAKAIMELKNGRE